MKCRLLCVMFLAVLSQTSVAQEQQLPSLLTQAGTCLFAIDQNWLGNSNGAQWARFAWVEDRTDSPGERHVYMLAQYDAGTTQLFDIRFESRHRQHILTLENMLDLVRVGTEDQFASPPAGGPRMSRLYHDAIVKIRRRVSYDVRLSRLKQRVPNVICNIEAGNPPDRQ